MPYTIINGQVVPINESVLSPAVSAPQPQLQPQAQQQAQQLTPESLSDYEEFSGEDTEGLAPEMPIDDSLPKHKNDMSDLFEVPKHTDHDMQTDDLVALKEEDVTGGDMHDLFDVDFDRDVMGDKPKKRAEKSMQRTGKARPAVFPSLGGTR